MKANNKNDNQSKKNFIFYIIVTAFFVFIMLSFGLNFEIGKNIAFKFVKHSKFIFMILPGVFLLLGLFKVWVKNETVIKHLGEASGIKGYILALLLASTNIGGLFVSAPVAHTIYKKGAKLSVVLTYLGASCVCRIPMTLWEASMLGLPFTIARFMVSIPLIIITSIIIEKVFFKNGYEFAINDEGQ